MKTRGNCPFRTHASFEHRKAQEACLEEVEWQLAHYVKENHRLSEQLSQQKLACQQSHKLLAIVTKEKDYYYEELKNVEEHKHKETEQLQHQIDSKSLLANQLKTKNKNLLGQIATLEDNLQEANFLLGAQSKQVERIQKEKQLIEKQWNRVIEDVNRKMNKMNKVQHNNRKMAQKHKAVNPVGGSLGERVSQVLKRIDERISESQSTDFDTQSQISLKQSSRSQECSDHQFDHSIF